MNSHFHLSSTFADNCSGWSFLCGNAASLEWTVLQWSTVFSEWLSEKLRLIWLVCLWHHNHLPHNRWQKLSGRQFYFSSSSLQPSICSLACLLEHYTLVLTQEEAASPLELPTPLAIASFFPWGFPSKFWPGLTPLSFCNQMRSQLEQRELQAIGSLQRKYCLLPICERMEAAALKQGNSLVGVSLEPSNSLLLSSKEKSI